MENRLKKLFDFQRFEGNSRLAKMIAESESRRSAELSDDQLELVSAAGDYKEDEKTKKSGFAPK